MLYAYLKDTVAAPDPTLVHSYTKDMGLTRTEFERTLPKAIKGQIELVQNDKDQSKVQIMDGYRRATIQYRLLPTRILGSLRLPRLRVDIGMSGFSHASSQAFIERFDRLFLRMGGG